MNRWLRLPTSRSAALVLLTCAFVIASSLTSCRTRDTAHAMSSHATVLLFAGDGTSPSDVAAIEEVLANEHIDYSKVDSAGLNAMTEAQLRQHRLLIVPGGNFETLGNHLSASATANIRNAVQGGLNYVGICAGAFFAGDSPYNGLNLTKARFGFYSAEAQGIRKTAVAITDASGQTLDVYWEDGPQLAGWGSVVAKYPDGTPAVVQGTFGSGSVVLSGVHPEAPASWRRAMNFNTSADVDHAYAANLIRAAVNRESLSHF